MNRPFLTTRFLFSAFVASIPFFSGASLFANPGDVRINEFVAINRTGLLDEDGDTPDWIELRNRTEKAINLGGWSLTDNPSIVDKWVFPPVALPPNGFLVVFASGKNRPATETWTGPLHTNFKISGSGEYLGLYDNSQVRQVVSEISPSFPTQFEGVAYGYDEPSAGYRYLTPPTPGASNAGAAAVAGPLEPAGVEPPRGFFDEPTSITLTHPNPQADIYYTTDGNTPSPATGTLYTGPIPITETTPLRVKAYTPDNLPSETLTHTYFIGESEAVRSMPIYSIVTDDRHLYGRDGILGISGGDYDNGWKPVDPGDYHNPMQRGRAWERPASFEYFDPARDWIFQVNCGLRVQGSDYTRPRYTPNSKFSYRLYFRDDYGPDELVEPIIPRSPYISHRKIVIRAGHNDDDSPFYKDELMRRLYADMGRVSAQGAFANLFLNGVRRRDGFYNPTERLDHDFFAEAYGVGEEWDTIRQGSSVADGDALAWKGLLAFATSTDLSDPAAYLEVARRLDVVNFVDYLLLNMFGATWDWPNNNFTAARPKTLDGKFGFYVWDAEGAFGSKGVLFNTIASDLLRIDTEIPQLYRALQVNEDFQQLFASRFRLHFFGDGALTEANVFARSEEARKPLAEVIPLNNGAAIIHNWIEKRRAVMVEDLFEAGLLPSVESLSESAPPFEAPRLLAPLPDGNGPDLNDDGGVNAGDLLEFIRQERGN